MTKFKLIIKYGEQTNAQRGCVIVWPGASLAPSSGLYNSPRWRLRGDARCVGVATQSPRGIQRTLAGVTADDEPAPVHPLTPRVPFLFSPNPRVFLSTPPRPHSPKTLHLFLLTVYMRSGPISRPHASCAAMSALCCAAVPMAIGAPPPQSACFLSNLPTPIPPPSPFYCCGAFAFAAVAAPAAAAHHHPLLGVPLGPRALVAPANIKIFTQIVSLALSSLSLVAVVLNLPTPAGVYAGKRWSSASQASSVSRSRGWQRRTRFFQPAPGDRRSRPSRRRNQERRRHRGGILEVGALAVRTTTAGCWRQR